MKSPVSRFVRLLMLALMLAVSRLAAGGCAGRFRAPGPPRHRDRAAVPGHVAAADRAAGLDPNSVKVVLLNDPEINAFVAQGQTVYLQSGLIDAADNVNQVQGVVAHELGHVAGGHSIRSSSKASNEAHRNHASRRWCSARWRSRPAPAMPAWASSWPASAPRSASCWRSPAPRKPPPTQAARQLLSKAGISGKGLLDFFDKLQNQEYRLAIYSKDSFDRTHPLSSERIQALEQKLQGRSRLEQAGRSGARSAVRAGQGQAARLRRTRSRPS